MTVQITTLSLFKPSFSDIEEEDDFDVAGIPITSTPSGPPGDGTHTIMNRTPLKSLREIFSPTESLKKEDYEIKSEF